MPNFPLYHCPCTSPLLPPSTHPSSSASLHPLDSLYFCDECDAIRCDRCVQVEVASYFCPNCLFEVPNASVRAERNRCARNCFQCPECPSALHVVASDPPPSSPQATGQPPYLLECRACGWNSSSLSMSFSKPLGLAHQVLDQERTSRESTEVDRLQSHFDHYLHRLTQSLERETFFAAPRTKKSSLTGKTFGGKARYPLRGSPGSAGVRPTERGKTSLGSPLHASGQRGVKAVLPPPISEDPDGYRANQRWVDVAQSAGESAEKDDFEVQDDSEKQVSRETRMVRQMMEFTGDSSGFAGIEKLWDQSWAQSRTNTAQRPTRIPLLAKRTKRCPACTHTLIRPESKPHSTRFKIKVAAINYLPGVELGGRRMLGPAKEGDWWDGLKAAGAKERMDKPLRPGYIYAFQLALTNPLLESISITLTPRCISLVGLTPHPEKLCDVWFPMKVVQVGAFGETTENGKHGDWAEAGDSLVKVGFCVVVHEANRLHVPPNSRKLELQFDLGLEFTYTVEEEYALEPDVSSDKKATMTKVDRAAVGVEPQLRKVEKTFSFDTRVSLGAVARE